MAQVVKLTPTRRPTLTEQFAAKLPNSYLYAERDLNSNVYRDSISDWFHFLSRVDEASGRATRARNGARDEFHYIQWSRDAFQKIVVPLIKPRSSFVDVGCGGGDKLAVVKAAKRSVRVTGIEHDPTMAFWASMYADRIICDDALQQDYSGYDFIYAFWPIANHEMMEQLLDRIVDQMKVGASFFLVGWPKAERFKKIFDKPKAPKGVFGTYDTHFYTKR